MAADDAAAPEEFQEEEQHGHGEETSKRRPSDVRVLILMPAIGFFVVSSPFAAVTLHYTKHGWELWRLGALQLCAFGLRNCVAILLTKIGPCLAPFCCFAAFLGVLPACLWPEEEWAVTLQLASVWLSNMELAWQGVAFERFSQSPKLLQRASRIQVLSGTSGYAIAPFVIGLCYDFLGGWRSCAIVHAVCFGSMTLTYATHPVIWQDYLRWRGGGGQRSSASSRKAQSNATHGLAPTARSDSAEPANDVESSPLSQAMHCASPQPGQVETEDSREETPKAAASLSNVLIMPAIATAVAQFATNWSYLCEWATFAIFFREEHNWDNAFWAGFTQMIGDIVGAALLVMMTQRAAVETTEGSEEVDSEKVVREAASDIAKTTGEARKTRRTLLPQSVFGKPYNLSWLLFGWILTNLGLAAPSLTVAITCQVLMGTIYVFCVQYVNEMSMLYAFGCTKTYMELQTFMQMAYSVGCASSGLVSLYIFDVAGRLVPFYVSAAICVAAFIFYTSVFLLRVGCPPSLEALENKRRNNVASEKTRV
eukprot:TRINITY_DN28880_c0_g1_i4.p1 TRINITY_DN28880_c0_g1~~TRINITY_DN28880_c0_g1_i4.p1  ORF type:complete len:538 (+),score=69.14 TRINITY_DN28880_c0_g1_i4:52-1665(+)